MRDRVAGDTTIVGTYDSYATSPSISADGRYVAFLSISGLLSLVIRDRLTGESWTPFPFAGPASGPYSAPKISGDGRFVSYWHFRAGPPFADSTPIYDRVGETRQDAAPSSPRTESTSPTSVAAGRLAFASASSTIVSNDTNDVRDVFLTDFSQAEPPGAPRNLTFTVVDSTLTLAWQPPAEGGSVSSYIIVAASKSMGGASPVRVTGTSYSTTFAGSGPYYIRVQAENSLSRSGASNEVVVLQGTLEQPPGPPTRLMAASSGSTVTLTWTAPINGGRVQGYRLGVGPIPFSDLFGDFDIGATTTTVTITGAPAGSYYLRLLAKNAAGFSVFSNEASLIVLDAGPCSGSPGAPKALNASVSGSTVTLSWSGPAGVSTSYVVEAGSSRGLSDLASFDTGGVMTIFTASVPSGTYFVRARGKNACGVGAASNEVAVLVRGS